MGHKTIDMSFLLKLFNYVESGYPTWKHEEKREIILKEQEKTIEWQNYCKSLQEKINILESQLLQQVTQKQI